MSILTRDSLERMFEEARIAHFASLTVEDFMEGWNSAHQRKITLVALESVARRQRPFSVFNEMVVLYIKDGVVCKVVPDNMVVLTDRDYEDAGSFDYDTEPVKPFLMIEYVSPGSERKDYERNLEIYEQDLKVPYYLIYCREAQEMTLFRLVDGEYRSVPPDDAGHCAIPEIGLKIGLIDGWLRYWHQDQLMPLPGEAEELRAQEQQRREDAERLQLQAQTDRQEERRLRREAERQAQDAERQRQDAARQAQDAERQRQDAVKQRDAALLRQQQLEDELERLRAAPPTT